MPASPPIGSPSTIIPFPAHRVRLPTYRTRDPWQRCSTTALVLRQFEGLDQASCDALVDDMVSEDPAMLAGMLERTADDINFLRNALSAMIEIDERVAAAAGRVLAMGGI